MKPRKVLYIIRVAKGGTPIVVDQIARGLDRDRYEPITILRPLYAAIIYLYSFSL